MTSILTIDATGIVRHNGALVARINNDGTGRRWLSRCDDRGQIQEGDGYRIADVQRWWWGGGDAERQGGGTAGVGLTPCPTSIFAPDHHRPTRRFPGRQD